MAQSLEQGGGIVSDYIAQRLVLLPLLVLQSIFLAEVFD
jgi:hypothetical protein